MSDGRTHWEGCERDRAHHECALARLGMVTVERDTYKAHHMNLLGLLDLYFERTEEARSERDALAEALRKLILKIEAFEATTAESGDSRRRSFSMRSSETARDLCDELTAARAALTPPRAEGGKP